MPFRSEIEPSLISSELNDPFDGNTPEICKLAAQEVQAFITENEADWKHNFGLDVLNQIQAKGKMFGVLVVRNGEGKLGYLFTFSGKLADASHHANFVPSIFDVSTDDFFINRGMTELTAIGHQLGLLEVDSEITLLREERKQKSIALQKQLFDGYHFLNHAGESKSVLAIFEKASNRKPPSGAGECAAPKLLHYAFQHQMQPLAIAEFWWGKSPKSGKKAHKNYYPACEDKCRSILGYMLGA